MALPCIIRNDPDDPAPWEFETMAGTLNRRGEQLEVLQRKGLADLEWRETGVRAVPSRVVTTSYYADRDAANSYYDTVIAAIGQTKQVVKFGSIEGYYVIENVTKQGDVAARQNVVGALVADATVVMRLMWFLRHVPDPS